MHQSRWNKIESILDTALTLTGDERTTYINEACGKDQELLKEVYEILEAVDESERTRFLEGASRENKALFNDFSATSDTDDLLGTTIGSFTLIEKVGKGGMGTVYKAERADGQFTQHVAIKLLQKGIQSEETLRRFRMEQAILAGLKHPHIAQLYDGGLTDSGLPYLVMEYVDGVPIDQYCNEQQLAVEERIALFTDVCSAMQFAHTNLVIHRDLKAQNIYVTSDGNVKVLDFGIAKLLDPKLTEQTLLETRPGQNFWTPQYAAPEQVKGEAVTTATDVYALGVLLHKLLTGTYPLDLTDKSIAEVERIISDKAPAPMSQSVQEAGLKKTLTGDLDALVLKALRKEPEYRYNSVGQLLEELDRYLNGFPVRARPETISYRAQKFIRRNKLLVLGSAAFLIILVAATILSTSFALQAKRAQALAQTEAVEAQRQTNIANAVNDFLQQILLQADPQTNPEGADLTLGEAIELAGDLIEESFKGQPEVEAAVRRVLGTVDRNLGRLEQSVQQFEKALSLSQDLYGEKHRQTLTSRAELGLSLTRLDRNEKATQVLKDGLEAAKNAPQKDWEASIQIYNNLALIYLYGGDGSSAEPLLRIAAKRDSAVHGPQHSERLTTLHNLSAALWMQGKQDNGIKLAKDVLERRKKSLGNFHPDVAQSLNVVSHFLMQQQNYEEALVYRQADLEMRQSLYQEDHPDLARSLHNTAHVLRLMERSEEAKPLQEEAVAMWKRTLPQTHSDVFRGHIVLANIYQSLGQDKKAILTLENYLKLIEQTETDNPLLVRLLLEISQAHVLAGNLKAAEVSFNKTARTIETNGDQKTWQYHSVQSQLGSVLMEQGRMEEAKPLIFDSISAISKIESAKSEIIKPMIERAIKYCITSGMDDERLKWEKMLTEFP